MYRRYGMLVNQHGTGANPFDLCFVNSCFQVAPCSRSERSGTASSLCSADGLPVAAFSCIWCPGVGFSLHQLARSSSRALGTDPNLMVEHTQAEQESPWPWSTAAGWVLEPAHLLPSLTLRRYWIYSSLHQLFPESLQYMLTGSYMSVLRMLYRNIKTDMEIENLLSVLGRSLLGANSLCYLYALNSHEISCLKETDECFK